jgi:hypothetical protein
MPYIVDMNQRRNPINIHGTMGRPPTHPKRLLLAVSEEFLAKLDAWRAAQPGISPTRSDSIRYLVERGMGATKLKPSVRRGKRR